MAANHDVIQGTGQEAEEVILVDASDQPLGTMEKMQAHRIGALHRAFSVFLFNNNREMLLQQRALNKYHSPGLWSNACCSHPRPGEDVATAASRRVKEELGIEVELHKLFHFTYTANLENGLIEHEFDHVFAGRYNGDIPFNDREVRAVKFESPHELSAQIVQTPGEFTPWFRIAFSRVIERWTEMSDHSA